MSVMGLHGHCPPPKFYTHPGARHLKEGWGVPTQKTAMLGLSGGAWPWVHGSSSRYVSPWVLEYTYCLEMIVLPTTV